MPMTEKQLYLLKYLAQVALDRIQIPSRDYDGLVIALAEVENEEAQIRRERSGSE